jgi:hypothetical protein
MNGPGRPELAWLVACLRALGERRAPPSPDAVLDWAMLLEVADAQDLLPALGHAMAIGGWAGVPLDARRRLTGSLATGSARHLVMTRELARVLRRGAEEGIEILVLKGPALAESVYPHPALRPFGDLDLLVRPADRLRMDAVLRALGHRRVADEHSWEFDVAFDGATVYEAPTGVRVDLHWSLLTEPRFTWNDPAQADVWERAVPLTLAETPARGLGPEDLVLHLAAHLAVHHSLTGLLRAWDIALILGRDGDLDWDALLARAARWRIRRAVFFVLLGVRDRFAIPVPPRVLNRLRPAGPRAALLAALMRGTGAERLQRLEHLVSLLLVDRGRDVAATLRRAVWPAADWMRARYGRADGTRPALYLTHVRRLGGVIGHAAGLVGARR